MKKLLQVGCLGSIVLFGVLIVIGLLMDLPGNSEEDGELVTTAMRTRTEPQKVRSARVELHAGEPCYQLAAQTGIQGVRARVRLIRLPQQ